MSDNEDNLFSEAATVNKPMTREQYQAELRELTTRYLNNPARIVTNAVLIAEIYDTESEVYFPCSFTPKGMPLHHAVSLVDDQLELISQLYNSQRNKRCEKLFGFDPLGDDDDA